MKEINILFAATSDFSPYALVTAMSVIQNCKSNVHIHFMYADIVKEIDAVDRNKNFQLFKESLETYNADVTFYDVKSMMYLLEGQNIGMWGKNISFTHYIYLLAEKVLKCSKVIYLDTDMIVNTDFTDVYETDMGKCVIGMGAPRGKEDMGDDVCNSGFVIMNLDLWRKTKILDKLLNFGKTLPKSDFCDQNLLYQYFTKNHSDELFLFPKEYNIFPQLFPELTLEQIKILHFTGWYSTKPWVDKNHKQRFSEIWWKYAKDTPFYNNFRDKLNKAQCEKCMFGWEKRGFTKIFRVFYLPVWKYKKKDKRKKIYIFGIPVLKRES